MTTKPSRPPLEGYPSLRPVFLAPDPLEADQDQAAEVTPLFPVSDFPQWRLREDGEIEIEGDQGFELVDGPHYFPGADLVTEVDQDQAAEVDQDQAAEVDWRAGLEFKRPGWLSGLRPSRAVIAAVPVLAVNICAFLGQLLFLRTHFTTWGLPGQLLAAFALESMAVYLSYHAHVARLADDSVFRLQTAAYALAALIGAMNYSHWAGPDWRPNPIAVMFALFSAVSPWLWGVHSRRESRDALKASGLIEPHAVRLGANRWFWYPVRSAKVTRLAAWEGINHPGEAIALHDADALPALELDAAELANLTPRDRLVVAFGAVGAVDVPKALAMLEQAGAPVDQSHAYQIRKSLTAAKECSS